MFVRLPPDDRAELLAIPGAAIFAPMEGRPKTEYVTLPDHWRDEPERARSWLLRSFLWAADLPPKEPKKREKRGQT